MATADGIPNTARGREEERPRVSNVSQKWDSTKDKLQEKKEYPTTQIKCRNLMSGATRYASSLVVR